MKIKLCEKCNAEFKPKNSSQKYCCFKCSVRPSWGRRPFSKNYIYFKERN